jgi:hypothetical protein
VDFHTGLVPRGTWASTAIDNISINRKEYNDVLTVFPITILLPMDELSVKPLITGFHIIYTFRQAILLISKAASSG